MTLVLDAAPLSALLDPDDRRQPVVHRILAEEPGSLVLPAPISAEVDYLVGKLGGRPAQRVFLQDLADGRFLVACLDQHDYGLVQRYDEQYGDLDVGLADLSVVVLAHRFRTSRLLTFDQRHFRALRPLDGGTFTLLPYDISTPL